MIVKSPPSSVPPPKRKRVKDYQSVDTKHTYVNLNESMLVYDLKNEFYHLMNTEEMNKNQVYPFNDEEKVKFEEIYLSNKKKLIRIIF